jgi:hypothetical protein
MPRPLQRIALEAGLKLDINRLARGGFITPGAISRPVGIRWTNSRGDVTHGIVTADMSEPNKSWLRIQIGSLDQRIILVARRRHFGGHQWFFMCPSLNQRAMVLWLPPGARSFACRQSLGRQVAYATQFMTPANRAHHAEAKMNARLCEFGRFQPNDWDIPPKPKWMRWATYRRAHQKFDRHEAVRDRSIASALERLQKRHRAG